MVDNRKLPQYLKYLGFSLLGVLLLGMTSCNHHVIAEYSFHNKLDKDVELHLFVGEVKYKNKIPSSTLILSGDSVKLLRVETDDRSGFGGDYFHSLIDSAKVKIYGQDEYIAIWRLTGESELSEGYKTILDFYHEWFPYRQHGGSHAEYIYFLKLEEDD